MCHWRSDSNGSLPMQILLAYKVSARAAADPYTSLLPIGLGYLNAMLRRAGHRSRIANLSSASWEETAAILASERPGIIGISVFTHNRRESLKLAELAKKLNPRCFTVLGGPHASHRSREILAANQAVDAVIEGEGEETFCELAACLVSTEGNLETVRGLVFRRAATIVRVPSRPPLADLDSLPGLATAYGNALGVDFRRQLEFIITSRGCPASCSFCSSPRFWGKSLRFRSPRAIVDEIRYIRDTYGLIYFSIRDDTFTADRQRVLEFCRLLVEERLPILWNCQSRVNAVDEEMLCWMKRAGCECVQFGVESGSPRVLEALGKRITPDQVRRAALAVRRAGINLSIYLISGAPGETEEDLEATLRLIDDIRPADGQVSPLVYYPGTALFSRAVQSGAVPPDLFEKERGEAFRVRSEPFVSHAGKVLLRRLQRVAGRSHFTAADFRAQKRLLGYCHATNCMAGEMYEAAGEYQLAEREYREIVEREPANPWGWLLLGDLYGSGEDLVRSRQAYGRLVELVPAHAPAYVALGELLRLDGDLRGAERMLRQALRLNPLDEAAQRALLAVGG